MQRIQLTLPPKFPRIKTTHFQQFSTAKLFTSIISYNNNNHPLKFGNCRDSICCCSTKFSSISRVFLKWTSFNGNFPRYACEDVNSYYGGIGHLKGKALSKKLNSIIAGHHSLSYEKVWDALKILDAADVDKPEVSSEIVEIYSGRAVPKRLAGKPEGWNREHLWPRSYGLIHGPSLTDLHNIRPADVNVNSSRGNKYFGECQVGSTRCMKPANKEAAPDTETDMKIWAPPMQVRGDVARAVMYMAVRYGFHQPTGDLVLRLSDSPSIVKKKMGLLSILLKWNELDPPSHEENLRNERVCKLYQHNRNPFVDHPEYANLIWKHAGSRQHSSSTVPVSYLEATGNYPASNDDSEVH